MTSPRMLVEIGTIHGIMIVALYNPRSNQPTYQVKAETCRFSNWFIVGTWDTFEEAMEEFQKWDAVRKTQMEDEE